MAKDAGDHVLRRRLTVAARDCHDRNFKSASVMGGQLLVGKQRIPNAEKERVMAGNAARFLRLGLPQRYVS